MIGDKEARGNPDFNYEAFLFEDIDVDAIDDRIESAFGLSNQVQDTDGDQVFDGDEFYVYEYGDTLAHDIDKDGVPNWLDEDSDNDGIPDRIEKAKDLEQDGLAAFVDLDSDGNNIEDKIEVGDNNLNPTDSDLDGDADYIDIDDDNDGLLDVNDNEPREKVLSLMPNSEGYKDITSVSYLYNGEEIDDINLALEPHLLKGYGLSPDGYLVFIGNKNQSPINTRVTTDKNENIIFTMPKGMQSMFYYANGSRTNIVKINYSNNIPIINKLSKDYYQEGETVYITGRYFNEDTRVMVEGNEIIPVISSPTNLSLILPQTTSPTIRVNLKTSYGESNKKELKIGNNISLQLHLPQNTQVDYSKLRIESLRSPTGTAYTFAADLHSDMVVGGGHDVIIISYQDDSGSYWPYLYQVTFGNSTQFEASPLNSSKSVSWYLAGIKNLVPSSEWGDFFDKLSNLKEIEDLANFIALNASDLEYAKNNSSSYQPLEDKAVNAARSLALSLHQGSIKSTSFHPPKTAQSTAQLPKREYKPNIQSD